MFRTQERLATSMVVFASMPKMRLAFAESNQDYWKENSTKIMLETSRKSGVAKTGLEGCVI